MKIPVTTYETIDPGLYPGHIETIEEDEGQFGPQLKYSILLDQLGTRLTTWSSQSLSVKSKLYRWAVACFGGKPLPDDFVLDTETLINRPIMVSVTMKDTEMGTFNRVADLLPMPKTAAPKPKPASMLTQAGQRVVTIDEPEEAPFPEMEPAGMQDEIPF